MQTVHLNAHNSIAVVETKIELDSHAETCVLGHHCLIIHDHNRAVNVYGYDPKAGSKHTCIFNVTVAYTVPKTDQVVILSINQATEMKGLNHHLLLPMQCHVNGVLINEVPKFLAPIPSETMHAIKIKSPIDATHPLIIPLKLKKSMKTRTSSRLNSWWKLHYGAHLALNVVSRNRV